MRNKILAVSLLLAACLCFGGRSKAGPANEKVTLELLNPMGVIEPEPATFFFTCGGLPS